MGGDGERLPLFAFGTLRRGEENHHLLAGRFERVLPARLPGYAVVGPLMIDRADGGTVPGELFFLRPDAYAAVMADCDELEEVASPPTPTDPYERRRVRVLTALGEHDAWAYVRPETGARCPVPGSPRAETSGHARAWCSRRAVIARAT